MTQKLYETDAYVQEFAAAVLSCTPAKGGYAVVLDRTAFFPEGGGQPCDLGTLGTAKVTDVHTDGATITHTTDAPLEPGTAVTGRIDWPRRLDAMQQHTGEHILSGTLHRLFGAENVGFHIGTPYVRMDTSIPLSAAQLAEPKAATVTLNGADRTLPEARPEALTATGVFAPPLDRTSGYTVAVLAADGQYTADALTGPLNGIYSAVSLEWDAMADSAEGGLFRRARLTDLLAAYGADACQDLVLIPFKTNLEDSDLTTEEYNLTGLLDYPILANAGCFALQDTGDAAALKSAESAVLWLYSSGDGEKALTNTLGVITPWNTASDTTTLGAMQVEQVNTAILPGIDLPTAAAAQALTANEEALQGGTRGKAERTAFTQAALAALGAE